MLDPSFAALFTILALPIATVAMVYALSSDPRRSPLSNDK